LEFIFLHNDYALWFLFGVFVGIALSIDLGIFGKLKNILIKHTNQILNKNREILDSNYEFSQKLQQQQTRNALKWTIV